MIALVLASVALGLAVAALAVTLMSRRRVGRWGRSARRRGGMLGNSRRWDGGR